MFGRDGTLAAVVGNSRQGTHPPLFFSPLVRCEMTDPVTNLQSLIEETARVRNLDVVRRLLDSPRGRKRACRYQKLWYKIEREAPLLIRSYEAMMNGTISHDLIECHWEARHHLNQMRRHLCYRRRCGSCLMCKFVNPQE